MTAENETPRPPDDDDDGVLYQGSGHYAVAVSAELIKLRARVAELEAECDRLKHGTHVADCRQCGRSISDIEARYEDGGHWWHHACRLLARAESAEARVKELEPLVLKLLIAEAEVARLTEFLESLIGDQRNLYDWPKLVRAALAPPPQADGGAA